MAYENDYLMRMIKQIARAIAAFALGKDLPPYELPDEKDEYTHADHLYEQLIQMVNGGEINEAEDILFEHIDSGIDTIFYLGMNFYLYVNEFSNDELEENGYSREEIIEGMKDFAKACHVEVSDSFFDLIE